MAAPPFNQKAVLPQSSTAFVLHGLGRFSTEGLDGLGGLRPLLLDGRLQDEVLDFYGATLLGSANISQTVPFVNAFPSSFSQSVPAFHT